MILIIISINFHLNLYYINNIQSITYIYMRKTCNKCNKVFKSIYVYELHINKAVSCDTVLQCDKCSKIFKIKRYLLEHLNRKRSCIPINDNLLLINDNIKLNVKLEQLVIEREKLAIREKALNLEQEKLALEREKLAVYTRLADQKKDNALALIEAKATKAILVEHAKTERKELTPAVVTVNNYNIKIDNFKAEILIIYNKLPKHKKYDFDNINQLENKCKLAITLNSTDDSLKQYDKMEFYKKLYFLQEKDYIKHTLKYYYIDNGKTIFYSKELGVYFVVYTSQKNKEIEFREIPFDTVLRPRFQQTLVDTTNMILDYVPKITRYITEKISELDLFEKIADLKQTRRSISGNSGLEHISAQLFEVM